MLHWSLLLSFLLFQLFSEWQYSCCQVNHFVDIANMQGHLNLYRIETLGHIRSSIC